MKRNSKAGNEIYATQPGPPERSQDDVELDTRLAQLAALSSEQRAPWRVRQRLLAEVELRLARPSQPRPRFLSAWTLALPAFAVLFLLVASQPSLRSTLFPQGGKSSLPSLLSSLTPSRIQSQIRAWVHSGSGMSAVTQSQPDGLSTASYVTLPYSDPSIANGTEITVRVTVPSSELMAWGVPAPEGGLDEEVPADLVLGDDGLPQAIRVLSPTSSTSTAEEIYP